MSGGNWKAMFKGIQENDLELVHFYLKSGTDPNFQHPEFMALPLAESVRYDHFELTELLLQNGAKPTILELESGMSALELVKNTKSEKWIALLEKFCA